MKAAVLWERRTPLAIEEVEIADPAPGEARPRVLGHEAAGVVEAVGAGVTRVEPGDRVISAFGVRCGECFFCVRGQPYLCATPPPRNVRLRRGDTVLNPFLAVGSFAEYANVDARNLVRIPEEIPIECAALIACGVSTGLGAVFNTARVEPGATV